MNRREFIKVAGIALVVPVSVKAVVQAPFRGINELVEGMLPPEWPQGSVDRYDSSKRYGAWVGASTREVAMEWLAKLQIQAEKFLPVGTPVDVIVKTPEDYAHEWRFAQEGNDIIVKTPLKDLQWTVGWKTLPVARGLLRYNYGVGCSFIAGRSGAWDRIFKEVR